MPIITYISCMNCHIPVAMKIGNPFTFKKKCYRCGKLCGYTSKPIKQKVEGMELIESVGNG